MFAEAPPASSALPLLAGLEAKDAKGRDSARQSGGKSCSAAMLDLAVRRSMEDVEDKCLGVEMILWDPNSWWLTC